MSTARQSMSLKNDCSIYRANSIPTALSFLPKAFGIGPECLRDFASEERFRTDPRRSEDKSRNDRIKDFKQPLISLRINNIEGNGTD
jgi:hypothetical protein